MTQMTGSPLKLNGRNFVLTVCCHHRRSAPSRYVAEKCQSVMHSLKTLCCMTCKDKSHSREACLWLARGDSQAWLAAFCDLRSHKRSDMHRNAHSISAILRRRAYGSNILCYRGCHFYPSYPGSATSCCLYVLAWCFIRSRDCIMDMKKHTAAELVLFKMPSPG